MAQAAYSLSSTAALAGKAKQLKLLDSVQFPQI